MKAKVLIVLLACLLIACGSIMEPDSDDIIRQPEDAPAKFTLAKGMFFEENTCKSPMLDPKDGTELIMIRSWGNGIGDYRVPKYKYGLNHNEYVRLNCETGQLIGIVKK